MTTAPAAGLVPEWTIGDRLRKARELIDLDRGDFADEIGISRNSVTNYEHGKIAKPRTIVLRAWALRCGVDFDWLATGTPGQPTTPGGAGAVWAPSGSNRRPTDYKSPVCATVIDFRPRRSRPPQAA